MLAPFLVLLREGVEASLIVSIILAYLKRTGNEREFGKIWMGTGVAVLLSGLFAGLMISVVGRTTEGPEQMALEGFAMTIAVAVITFMVFWMRRVSRNIKQELQSKVDTALHSKRSFALALLAFVAVIREGAEVVLFLFAAAEASSPLQATLGSFLGLCLAVLIGYLVYKGSARINLKQFFHWTGVFLIIVAAGLVMGGIREFHELGWLPRIVQSVWDTSGYLSEDSVVGGLARALLGYDSSPSLLEVLGYCSYLVIAMAAFLKPSMPRLVKKSESLAD